MQGQTEPVGLEHEQLGAHGVHGHAVGVGVERDEEAGDVEPEDLTGPVQGEGAVLAAAPAHPRPHWHGVRLGMSVGWARGDLNPHVLADTGT